VGSGIKVYALLAEQWHPANKQVEAIAVEENGWLVITVMVRFF
jgi:hypothetical protein